MDPLKQSYSKCHTNVTVTGMRSSEDFPFLGGSAGGIETCNCGSDVIETKCPYKWVTR